MRSTDSRAGAKTARTCAFRPVPPVCPYAAAPSVLVQTFVRRMADRGVWISSVMMQYDRRYALGQLSTAHCSDDDGLREMAMTLFLDLESGMATGRALPP